jgi:hypothetical protein
MTPQSLVSYGLVVDDGHGSGIDGLFEGAGPVQDTGGIR